MNRKILASLLVIGVVGAAAGGSTFALFNDTETSDDNTFTAGALDLKIDWVEYYNGQHVETQNYTDNPGPIFDISDVKPGDHGEAQVSLHVFNNPAHVWMNVTQTANLENGCTEPEQEVDSTCGDVGEGEGELGEHLQFTIYRDHDEDMERDDNEEVLYEGTAEGLNAEGEHYLGEFENSTDEYVMVEWNVPRETGNIIQTDSKEFRFDFYAEQARHNNVTDEAPEEDEEPTNETEEENQTENETETQPDNETENETETQPDNETEECPNDMKWCPPEEEEEDLNDYYQVDLYSGEVVEDRASMDRISSDSTPQEMEHYIHGNVNESITEEETPGQVDCVVDESNQVTVEDGEATFNFTVEGECEADNLTVASYHKPYEGYDFERRGEQVLLDHVTDSYEAGNHSVTVDVPQ